MGRALNVNEIHRQLVEPTGDDKIKLAEAIDFLEGFLTTGRIVVGDVEKAAKVNGYSWRTMERATR